MKRFTLKRTTQFFTVWIALLVLPRVGEATTAAMLTDEQLATSARVILLGDVQSVKAQWDQNHQINTYIKVQISAVIKGQLQGSSIVFNQPGGTVGDQSSIIFGAPAYRIGQRVLLFLDTRFDGTLRIAHLFQGSYEVLQDPDGSVRVSRNVQRGAVNLLGASEGPEITNSSTLRRFTKKVRSILLKHAGDDAEAASMLPIVEIPAEYVDDPGDGQSSGNVSPEFVFFSPGLRWVQPDSGQPVTYRVNTNAAPIAGGGITEMNQALAAWSNVQTTALVLQNIGSTTAFGFQADGVTAISYNDPLDQMSDPVGCSGTLAIGGASSVGGPTTTIGGQVFNRIYEGDVVFNRNFQCFLGISANLAEIATHEIGHSIGFDHSSDQSAIMWPTAHGSGRGATLGSDDIAAVTFLYPGTKNPPPPPPPPPGTRVPFDFDGDSKADLSIYRPVSGTWFISGSASAPTSNQWGVPAQNDVPVPADYDGDGKNDLAVWRPASGVWYIINSSNQSTRTVSWGNGNPGFNDRPVPGDYDGDGKADIAVWRPGTGVWYIVNSSNGSIRTVTWGMSNAPFNDVAVPADYDGDGKTDVAVWRTSTGVWFIVNSLNGSVTSRSWGNASTDVPVPMDYDGDKKADISIWRKSTGAWWIINSSNGSTTTRGWGIGATDVAVPADYDGDGKADLAVWRSASGGWWIINSSTGISRFSGWGIAGDVAVPSVYINN